MPRKYTENEHSFLRSFASGHGTAEIAEEFNRHFDPPIAVTQVRAYLKNHGIKTGIQCRFVKGHTPANKGKPGRTVGRMADTQFHKGNLPANHKPVGSESVRHNRKRGWKGRFVKVAEPNVWRMKHQVVWEEHHGPVPDGEVIVFLDGDTLNCSIENLTTVDRNTLARLNQNHLRTKSPELTSVGITTAKLICQMAKARERK